MIIKLLNNYITFNIIYNMTTWYYNDYIKWIINDKCNVNDKVTSLYIDISLLKNLTQNIDNLINLRYLHCNINRLTKLPETLGNLINLRALYCCDNKLTKLPKTIYNLINLQYLNFYNNKITELPETLSNLINLQILWCNDNKLTKLPETLDKLINLRALYCCNNKLTKLPISIMKLKHLEEIKYDTNIRIPINLQRFIERIKHKINNDVHNNSIQASLVDSINILLSENITKDINLLDDNILDNKSKSILYNFIEDKTQSYLLINFEELLVYVLEKIDN